MAIMVSYGDTSPALFYSFIQSLFSTDSRQTHTATYTLSHMTKWSSVHLHIFLYFPVWSDSGSHQGHLAYVVYCNVVLKAPENNATYFNLTIMGLAHLVHSLQMNKLYLIIRIIFMCCFLYTVLHGWPPKSAAY